MMLATSPYHMQSLYSTHSSSLPLAERSPNVIPRTFSFSMPSQSKPEAASVPRRVHKPNPLMKSRDAQAQCRRNMFFRKVQNEREDKKWGARGDQLERLDFFSHQKRWEAAKAQEAPQDYDEVDEALIDEMVSSQQQEPTPVEQEQQQEMSEAEWILAQEEQEMEELLAAMEAEQPIQDDTSQHYGSDDDDFDSIFMECAMNSEFMEQSQSINSGFDPEDMDMTDD